jgi:hypothetical protein
MYIRTLLETTHIKTVMDMNLSNSTVKRDFARVVPGMVTSLEV